MSSTASEMTKEKLEQQLLAFLQRQKEQKQEKEKEQDQKTAFEQKAKLEQELINHPHFMKEVNLDDPKWLALPFCLRPSRTHAKEGVYFIHTKYFGRFQDGKGVYALYRWNEYNIPAAFKITATGFVLCKENDKNELIEDATFAAYASLAELIKDVSELGLKLRPSKDQITYAVTMQSLHDKGIKTKEQRDEYARVREREILGILQGYSLMSSFIIVAPTF